MLSNSPNLPCCLFLTGIRKQREKQRLSGSRVSDFIGLEWGTLFGQKGVDLLF